MRGTLGNRWAGGRLGRAAVAAVIASGLVGASGGAAMGQAAPRPQGRGDVQGARPSHHDPAPSPYEPHVALGVPGIEADGFVPLRGGTVPVEVANRKNRPVNVELAVDVQADGARTRTALRELALAPLGTARFDVPLAGLGITPGRLQGPAVLTLRATTSDAAGNQIDGVVLPSVYVSNDPGGGLQAATEDHLLGSQKGRPGGPAGTISLFAGAAPGAFDPEAQPHELGTGLHTVCVHWQYASQDHNAGERYYAKGEPMAARGVKISVSQDGFKTTVHTSKMTGCISLPLGSGKPANLVVHPEARVGTADNITVRAKDGSQPSTQGWLAAAKNWSFDFTPGSDASHLYVPAGRLSTLMAYGTFSVQRLDHEAPLIEPEVQRTLDLVYSTKTNSDANGPVTVAATQYDRKFVYGHEIGHWYAGEQSMDFGGNPGYPSPVPECASRYDEDLPELNHLIRSMELSSLALEEGLAHFLSSIVWNGPGWKTPMFRYYKNLFSEKYGEIAAVYQDYETNHNRVDMAAATDAPLGGVRAWRDAVCGADDLRRYSVELDWARFFVNYLDGDLWWGAQGGASPKFGQLIAHLRHAHDNFYQDAVDQGEEYYYNVYWYLLKALQDEGLKGQDGFVERFRGFAWRYGVTLEAEG